MKTPLLLLSALLLAAPAPARAQSGPAHRIEARAEQRLPWIDFHFAGAHPDNAAAIAEAVEKLARDWPAVARRLKRVEMSAAGNWPNERSVAFSTEREDQHYTVTFRLTKFRSPHPNAAAITAHEWGHLVDYWLSSRRETHEDLDRFLQDYRRENVNRRGSSEGWADGFRDLYHVHPSRWSAFTRGIADLLAPHGPRWLRDAVPER